MRVRHLILSGLALSALSGCCGSIYFTDGEATVSIDPDADGGVALEGTVGGLDVELLERWAGRADPPLEVSGSGPAYSAALSQEGGGATVRRLWSAPADTPEVVVDFAIEVDDPTLGGVVDCEIEPYLFHLRLMMEEAGETSVALPADDVWVHGPDTMAFEAEGPEFDEGVVNIAPGDWSGATVKWDDSRGLSGELVLEGVRWQTAFSVYDGTHWCPQAIGATSTLRLTWSFDGSERHDYRAPCRPSESWG